MKTVSVVLFVLAGLLIAGGLVTIHNAAAATWATYVGAFVLPALRIWWGLIALRKASRPEKAPPRQISSVD